MGCDIHTVVEVKHDGRWQAVEKSAFDCRSYGLFGFLANVRNVSRVPNPWPPRGWPQDVTDHAGAILERWELDAHNLHWVSVKELKEFNYDKTFEDRRICKTVGNFTDCAALAEPGEGKVTTFREFLGEWFFNELEELNALGSDVRVLMFFDN